MDSTSSHAHTSISPAHTHAPPYPTASSAPAHTNIHPAVNAPPTTNGAAAGAAATAGSSAGAVRANGTVGAAHPSNNFPSTSTAPPRSAGLPAPYAPPAADLQPTVQAGLPAKHEVSTAVEPPAKKRKVDGSTYWQRVTKTELFAKREAYLKQAHKLAQEGGLSIELVLEKTGTMPALKAAKLPTHPEHLKEYGDQLTVLPGTEIKDYLSTFRHWARWTAKVDVATFPISGPLVAYFLCDCVPVLADRPKTIYILEQYRKATSTVIDNLGGLSRQELVAREQKHHGSTLLAAWSEVKWAEWMWAIKEAMVPLRKFKSLQELAPAVVPAEPAPLQRPAAPAHPAAHPAPPPLRARHSFSGAQPGAPAAVGFGSPAPVGRSISGSPNLSHQPFQQAPQPRQPSASDHSRPPTPHHPPHPPSRVQAAQQPTAGAHPFLNPPTFANPALQAVHRLPAPAPSPVLSSAHAPASAPGPSYTARPHHQPAATQPIVFRPPILPLMPTMSEKARGKQRAVEPPSAPPISAQATAPVPAAADPHSNRLVVRLKPSSAPAVAPALASAPIEAGPPAALPPRKRRKRSKVITLSAAEQAEEDAFYLAVADVQAALAEYDAAVRFDAARRAIPIARPAMLEPAKIFGDYIPVAVPLDFLAGTTVYEPIACDPLNALRPPVNSRRLRPQLLNFTSTQLEPVASPERCFTLAPQHFLAWPDALGDPRLRGQLSAQRQQEVWTHSRAFRDDTARVLDPALRADERETALQSLVAQRARGVFTSTLTADEIVAREPAAARKARAETTRLLAVHKAEIRVRKGAEQSKAAVGSAAKPAPEHVLAAPEKAKELAAEQKKGPAVEQQNEVAVEQEKDKEVESAPDKDHTAAPSAADAREPPAVTASPRPSPPAPSSKQPSPTSAAGRPSPPSAVGEPAASSKSAPPAPTSTAEASPTIPSPAARSPALRPHARPSLGNIGPAASAPAVPTGRPRANSGAGMKRRPSVGGGDVHPLAAIYASVPEQMRLLARHKAAGIKGIPSDAEAGALAAVTGRMASPLLGHKLKLSASANASPAGSPSILPSALLGGSEGSKRASPVAEKQAKEVRPSPQPQPQSQARLASPPLVPLPDGKESPPAMQVDASGDVEMSEATVAKQTAEPPVPTVSTALGVIVEDEGTEQASTVSPPSSAAPAPAPAPAPAAQLDSPSTSRPASPPSRPSTASPSRFAALGSFARSTVGALAAAAGALPGLSSFSASPPAKASASPQMASSSTPSAASPQPPTVASSSTDKPVAAVATPAASPSPSPIPSPSPSTSKATDPAPSPSPAAAAPRGPRHCKVCGSSTCPGRGGRQWCQQGKESSGGKGSPSLDKGKGKERAVDAPSPSSQPGARAAEGAMLPPVVPRKAKEQDKDKGKEKAKAPEPEPIRPCDLHRTAAAWLRASDPVMPFSKNFGRGRVAGGASGGGRKKG
ncbi:hypothetical protein JCM10207_005016 [Rhodosporidiobolus poonsookiae]